jgi:catechol 2,3-dioxygenase-like lactoylglutathione lyase family enzyme
MIQVAPLSAIIRNADIHNSEIFMYDHISFGVTNLEKSLAFYDAALGALGINRMFALPSEGIAGYKDASGSSFWLYAKDRQQNSLSQIQPPSRFHLAFQAASRSAVDAFYAAAIAQGGTDDGTPGIRAHYHPNYYAAYVFDLENHP